MSDQTLWDDLRSNPENAKSSIQLAAEQREQERLRALQNIKVKPAPAAREAAAQRFRSIQAMNAAEKATAAVDVVNQRIAEVRQQILEACKDVTSAAEQAEIVSRAEPLLRRFATALDDYSVTEWVGHTLAAIRGEKAAKELTGY
jgi:hypothetical protein